MPYTWDDLPIDIRSIDDVNKFKSKLKTFLSTLGFFLYFCDYVYIYTLYVNNLGFLFFIQTFLKHCKAFSTEKYRRYIIIIIIIIIIKIGHVTFTYGLNLVVINHSYPILNFCLNIIMTSRWTDYISSTLINN